MPRENLVSHTVFTRVRLPHLFSFLCCAFFLRPVYCVPNVSDVSGLSILNCHFGFLLSFTVATMTCLTATDYLCHKWPRICSVRRNHNPVLSSFVTCHWVCNKSNTTGATRRAGTICLYVSLEVCICLYVRGDISWFLCLKQLICLMVQQQDGMILCTS